MTAATAGAHGRRILEGRDEANAAVEREHLTDYKIAGLQIFADGHEPAQMAETILGEIVGLTSVLGLAFDDAVYAQAYHPCGSSEMMQATPVQHARAMEAVSRLAALAGFYVSAAVRRVGV